VSSPHRFAEWAPHRVSDAELAVGPVAPGTRFRRHAHEGVHLCCVLAGGFVEAGRAGAEAVGPGTVRVSPSARHDIDFGPAGARCAVIELGADDAAVLGRLDRSQFLRDPWLALVVARLGVAAQRGEPHAQVALDGAVAELFAQIARRRGARASRTPPGWLEEARTRVRDEGGRPALADLAAALGVHRAHLARAFRDHYGVTLGAFARRLRVERALRLLAVDDQPLAAIAADAGFADQSHMTRAISAATGSSPRRLVRTLRERATPVQDHDAGAA
jgi:AraC family transcriptional regulator